MNRIACSFSFSSRGGVAVASIALFAGCGGSVERTASESTTGGTTTGTTTTASTTGASSSSGMSGTPPALVRFANLATPPAPAPFDVCTDTGAETGLLAADGLAEGVVFGSVSRYLPQPAGATWRLVSPGQPCSGVTAFPLAIDWPPGSENARVTVVPRPSAWGTWAGAYAFVDEPKNNQYGINVRVLDFLGLAPSSGSGPTMTVFHQGLGAPQPSVLFSELHFGSVPTISSFGPVTPAGFVHTPDIAVS
jgi:hypothetical protein